MSAPNRSDANFVSPQVDGDGRRLQPSPSFRLSNQLIGMKVVSPKGDPLGRIEDLVVHPGDEASYVVLSFGGWLGVGDKYFAMPWSVLKPGHQGSSVGHGENSLVLPLDKERLEAAPGIARENWPARANVDWTRDVNAFYAGHANPNTGGALGESPTAPLLTSSFSELEGAKVTAPDGTKLGHIEGLAVDSDGQVAYAALSVGGFLGIGERTVAVPWGALRFASALEQGDAPRITLATDRERIENAPLFEGTPEHAATMCDPAWIARVHEHFAVTPQRVDGGPSHVG